ncbi:MAG: hypothetical protein WD313_00310, partial [Acidimicrobiia bacterium]
MTVVTESTWSRAPLIYRVVNPFVRGLLRSPLHRLVSGRLMLLEYTGRTSGRRYSIPVGYFAWDNGSLVSFSGSRWWANLRGGRRVSLLIRGVQKAAAATVIESLEARVDLLGEFVRRYGPKVGRRLRMSLPADRAPPSDDLRS